MTDSPKDERFWRDFAHTLTVDMASALAAREIARSRPATRTRNFTLSLKAAAGRGGFVLPAGWQLTADGMIGFRFEAIGGDIRIELQLKGFAAIANFADCPARLLSDDGAIAIEVRFDRHGAASCVVPDDDQSRQSLRTLHVAIELGI